MCNQYSNNHRLKAMFWWMVIRGEKHGEGDMTLDVKIEKAVAP